MEKMDFKHLSVAATTNWQLMRRSNKATNSLCDGSRALVAFQSQSASIKTIAAPWNLNSTRISAIALECLLKLSTSLSTHCLHHQRERRNLEPGWGSIWSLWRGYHALRCRRHGNVTSLSGAERPVSMWWSSFSKKFRTGKDVMDSAERFGTIHLIRTHKNNDF